MPSSNPLDPTNYTTLLSGNRWPDGAGSVIFSFPANVPGNTITGLLPNERVFAELAIARANDVCNINLEAAPSGTTGQITFWRDTQNAAFGYAYYPPNGDVFITDIPEQLAAALYNTGWQTYIHELGHALGLRHPFDNSPFLNAALDTQQYTVMSYDPHPDQASLALLDQEWPATYMLYDIQALQALYGANMNTRSGNTTYFGASGEYALADNGKLIMTIWDGGGVDTIDASNQSNRVVIDLRPGYFSSIGAVANNIAIALGVTGTGAQSAWIENANGGAGNDTLTGNDIANVLNGGGGNDAMNGGGGNDILIGGGGTDSLNGDGGTGDEARYLDAGGSVTINLTDATGASNAGDALGDTYSGIEKFRLSGNDDTFIGSNTSGAYNWASGEGGNDAFTSGGVGTTNLFWGGAGNDTVTGSGGTTSSRMGIGNDTHTGGAGRDLMYGEAGNDLFTGGGGDDLARGGSDDDSLSGGANRDLLYGEAGNDSLFGGDGNDVLDGGADNDIMLGGAGNDIIAGGLGADIFSFDLPSEGRDTIRDFALGVDEVLIDGTGFGISAIVLHANSNPLVSGAGGQFLYDTDTGRLSFDSDGDGVTAAVWFATFTGRPTISASDFDVSLV
jgi:serralysin